MTNTESVGPNIRHLDKLFIAGQWVAPVAGGVIDVVSPNTERVIARTAEARDEDMDRAVDAARRAFDQGPWPRWSPAKRAEALKRLAAALQARESELAVAWTLQVGGLSSIAPFIVGRGTANVTAAVTLAETFAFEETVKTEVAAVGMVIREPVGVVAAIAPWNVPYMIMTGKLAPALLAGCTVIMKPSPETPLEAYIIAECAEEAGLPDGVVNLVPAHREASDYLVRHPGVDKVSFTGSTLAGRRIASVCGERIARCTLELGGKSAAILMDDFSTEDAAKLLAGTITLVSGQVCAMLTRIIVPKARHDALADALATAMSAVKVGFSDEPGIQMGPLAMKRQLERVERYVEQGQAEGANLVTGGGRPGHMTRGYFIEPTLFSAVDNKMTIAREEIFGPVLSLIPCEDVDDAIRIANASIYGLHGSVLTHDADAAYRVGRQVRTGYFSQNGMRTDFELPFGGFKQSGVGREGGAEGLMSYLETKTILLDGPPSHVGG